VSSLRIRSPTFFETLVFPGLVLVALVGSSFGGGTALPTVTPFKTLDSSGLQAAVDPYPPCTTEIFDGYARCGAVSMAYDASDHYTIVYMICLYGTRVIGFDSCTWQYSNGTWTNITSASGASPLPLLPTSLVWDAADGVILLFGGLPYDHTGTWASLWSYRAGVWTNLSASIPAELSDKFFEGSIYDSSDACAIVLFRSVTPSVGSQPASFFTSTWTYRSDSWSNVTNNSTVAHELPIVPSLADDPVDSGAVLYGGTIPTGPTNSTWLFSRGEWHPVSVRSSPPTRAQPSITYDSFDDYVLLIGGSAPSCTASTCAALTDEWTFSHGQWTNITASVRGSPPAEVGGRMTSDLADGYVLEGFGTPYESAAGNAGYQQDLYGFANGTWTAWAPPPASTAFWDQLAFLALLCGIAIGGVVSIVWIRRSRSPKAG